MRDAILLSKIRDNRRSDTILNCSSDSVVQREIREGGRALCCRRVKMAKTRENRVYFSVQLMTICAVVNLKCAPEKATCAVVILSLIHI